MIPGTRRPRYRRATGTRAAGWQPFARQVAGYPYAMTGRDDDTTGGAWRDERRLPLSELSRAVATSAANGQVDDATGGEAGAESAFGDEPFPADEDLDAVGDTRADGSPSAREFDETLREDGRAGTDPDPDSTEGRALRPSPQGRIGPV